MKTPYQLQCRAEFDDMIRNRAARRTVRRKPYPPLSRAILVAVVLVPDTMAQVHAAADRLMDASPEYAATCARLDAELAGLLAQGNPGIPGLVSPDSELLAHGFLEPAPTND